MSDLEDDLLALAGGDSGAESESLDVPLKRARNDDSSRKRSRSASEEDEEEEGDEDEEEDDAEEEAEDESDSGAADDADDAESGDVDLQNPYPLEGKYKDEADRTALLDMDEIEREQTLFERLQEMDRYHEKQYLQQRMKQQKEAKVETKTRSSSRKAAATPKLDKLSELRKQREQKSRRAAAADDYIEEEDEESADEEMEDADDAYGEEPVVWGSGKSRFKPRSLERASVADINRIRVGRSFLGKYLYYRKFEDVVVHTFGRINVGVDRATRKPMYRVVQIEEAINRPQKQYRMSDTTTDLYLRVSQNRTQTKEFPITVFSDSDILADEFERYAQELAKTNEDVPYADDVAEKASELNDLMNSGLSNQDIDEMVTRKREMRGEIRTYDAVYQKSKVLDELKVARQEGDTGRAKELASRLRQLDEVLLKDNERASKSLLTDMSKVNERNRKLNQTNIRRAELKSSQLRKTTDTSDGDPFSRLKTTTRIYYEDMVKEENLRALQDARANYDAKLAEKTAQEEQMAHSTYRVLGVFDRLLALVEVEYDPKLLALAD